MVLSQATQKDEGHGEVRTSCPHCNHVVAEPFTIRRSDPESTDKDGAAGSGAPGGKSKAAKSKGGGASGEW